MAEYCLFGKVVATPGKGEVLASHLLEAAEAMEGVEACRLYLVGRSPGEPDAVWVVEVWDDARSHRASLELDSVQELIAQARPIIAGMFDRTELSLLGGKGAH